MRKNILAVLVIAAAALLAWGGYYAYTELRGERASVTNQEQPAIGTTTAETINTTGLSLNLPAGFSIETFAKNLPGARVLAFDAEGNLWVSQPKSGQVTKLVIRDGKVQSQAVAFSGLRNPHGLAMGLTDRNAVYIAEETRIVKGDINMGGSLVKIADLPAGGRHTTRTLGFGPDGRLYVSIGSTCDVCNEKNNRIAKIFSMKEDGSDFKEVAKGLRNSVFFTWSPVDGRMWATEMGRDNLGNSLPPDEINIIEQGKDYGWPICYGQNIHDDNFDKNRYVQNPCAGKVPPAVELPAHSAPLGLAFVPEEGWPQEYWYNLFVAQHGSWNSTRPVGYKVVRVKLDAKGNYLGTEDFISGWLPENARSGDAALGRPVDILTQPGGIMYLSDDKAGVVYRITYRAGAGNAAKPDSSSVRLTSLKENQEISSPLVIKGEAVGTWFFEASFPVKLVDKDGNLIAQGHAQADGEWMTEKMVPFTARLEFQAPPSGGGWLVLEKDNPSGLPEHSAEVRFPVRFRQAASKAPAPVQPVASGGCVIGGCSGEICSGQEMSSLCVYKEEFACYKTAKCERQANGQCGWTQTAELTQCLASK